MKIFIVRGTGKTGRELIKQGLEHGHSITALVRNPDKFKLNNPNLKIIKGNVLKPDSFQQNVHEQDAVLSALGHKRFLIPTRILSKGTRNIINTMNKHNVKRFICITSLGVNDSRFKLGLYYTLFTIPFILLFYFLDKSRQEKLIMNSDLDWTIIRPGQLTNGKKRTNYKHGLSVGNYILTKMISRASVAHFMLNQLDDNTYLRKAPGIIN
ncbi:SDR family oxidoreductase [Galbibacter sp. EGI 63066]|uniref:NAD(P)-dependent oxidoreductase n=1 Tax=Galbibacter sp. EGI 63066 TaxID=2993559 RepID=UPI002248C5D8|nr:SDR family oxidoreductase [Galbibacter sp. EGI 63066]MCX2680258.1 SDR family oxidoreductase [Galbibacter sp. EGI 63066]